MHLVKYRYKKDYRGYPNHEGVFPVVEMNIEAYGNGVDLLAIVDTGAQNSLLSPQYALQVGLVLGNGNLKNFTTACGSTMKAYGHDVQIRILDEVFKIELFFCETLLPRCLIGRDILEKMQIGLNESLSTLYLF
jgi:hypothetical protein